MLKTVGIMSLWSYTKISFKYGKLDIMLFHQLF
jgi:hypothetical protein